MNSSALLLTNSTKSRAGTGEHLYNLVISNYIQNRNLFKDITAEDLVADNITYIFGEYFYLLIKHPIPKQWDRFGLWEEQENPVRLGSELLIKYVEPLFGMLKAQFPEHPYLKGDKGNPQEWWLKLKRRLRTALSAEEMKGIHETFDPKCRALYFVNDPKFIRHNDDTLKFDLLSQIDLRYLCSAMIRGGSHHGTNVYEQRAQLVTSSYAISRGGELKFLRFSDIVYDQRFNVTDTGWTVVKNAKKYSMPMVNCMHHDSPEIDFYHSMGCYAMMENGFVSKKEVSQDFVFPSLHAIRD